MIKHGWRIDDGTLWTELLGMVFAPALFFRAAVHVVTAGAADRDPRLVDSTDVGLASPVPDLRGRTDDAVARLGSVVLALMLAYAIGDVATTGIVGLWLTANWLVLLGDPIAGLVWWARQRWNVSSGE